MFFIEEVMLSVKDSITDVEKVYLKLRQLNEKWKEKEIKAKQGNIEVEFQMKLTKSGDKYSAIEKAMNGFLPSALIVPVFILLFIEHILTAIIFIEQQDRMYRGNGYHTV